MLEALSQLPADPLDECIYTASRNWSLSLDPACLDMTVSFGTRIVRVRCWHRVLSLALGDMLSPYSVEGRAETTLDLLVEDGKSALFKDGQFILEVRRVSWSPIIRLLAKELNGNINVAAVLHAAAVFFPGFGTVLLTAPTGAGKTTLTCGLISIGGRLLAEDATPIERGTGLAWPCPLPLSLKSGSWQIVSEILGADLSDLPIRGVGSRRIRFLPSPKDIDLNMGYPVRMILFPQWSKGENSKVRRLDPMQALSRLQDCGTWPVDDAKNLPDFLEWLEPLPCFSLSYGTTNGGLQIIKSLMQLRGD
ncbi:hypothetical protein C8J27_106269 [Rhodobacter aestuarii]|uniref:Hpr(Ser) kinase/phosphatase n=2 Tax=Rhodobacter aestuarii TaxID=453582 RepID=A0A1N7MCS8_9RHOB|nr:hypothetical protein C8J27_106269 [Rhodobacter aestuarii]SIS83894.1 hypothetical protein SAMN05421580_105269 [Rhodobacter aestuarii]